MEPPAMPASPPPAPRKDDHVTYMSVLKSDVFKVQMRSEKLLRELEKEVSGGPSSPQPPSKRRSEIDGIKRATADVDAVVRGASNETEERLALLQHLCEKMCDVETMVLHLTDGIVPTLPSAHAEGVLQYGQPAASRLPSFMGLVDRALALYEHAAGKAAAGGGGTAAAAEAEAELLASIAGQVAYQVGQTCGEAGAPVGQGAAATLQWCVSRLAGARDGRRDAEARADALEKDLVAERARAAAAEAAAAEVKPLRERLAQASAAATELAARLEQQREAAAAELAARGASLEQQAQEAREAAKSAATSAKAAAARAEAAEAARDADRRAAADEADRLGREFDEREAELGAALQAKAGECTRLEERVAALELRAQEAEADLAAERQDKGLAARASVPPDELGAVAARLREQLEASPAAADSGAREAAAALVRRLHEAERSSAQLATVRAAEIARVRFELAAAREAARAAAEHASELERAHAEHARELQERCRPESGEGAFEEALRGEMDAMKTAFELRLSGLRTQLSRQAAQHTRQARQLLQHGPAALATASAARGAPARPGTAHPAGARRTALPREF